MKKLLIPLLCALFYLPAITLAEDKAEATEDADPVIVTVNGVAITRNQIQHFLARQNKQIAPEDAVRELINVELVNQAARDAKLLENPVLQMEIHRVTTALIASTYLQQQLAQLEISDAQIEARYQTEYAADGGESSEYNASHILVETDDAARDIIRKLDEGGDFADLAKSLSTGPSGKKGGELGWFKQGDMVQPFSQAAMELEKGTYSSEPVQTQFGWHVIKLNDKRAATPPSLDSVRQSIATSIAADSIKAHLKKLHDDAAIVFIEQ